MRRTATRPLPSGRLNGSRGSWFGMLLSVAGGALLAVAVNWYPPFWRFNAACRIFWSIPR